MFILDSSFILSLIKTNEANHPQAKKLFKEILNQNYVLLVNNLILTEIATLSKTRFKNESKKIQKFCNDTLDKKIKYLKFEFINEKEFTEIFEISVNDTDHKNLSIADSSLVYHQNKIKGSEILTFDKNLAKISQKK